MDSIDPRQEEAQKAHIQRQEDIIGFCNDIKSVVDKYEGKVPMEIAFTQFAFWSNVFMKEMIEMSQTPPIEHMN